MTCCLIGLNVDMKYFVGGSYNCVEKKKKSQKVNMTWLNKLK